jgi:Ca2+-binding RTX toxin-like protein
LAGGSGADVVTGNGGNDVLYSGGNPLDPAYGDLGFEHDVLSGGDGTDRLNIGYGDDADGGAGTDWLDANFSAAPMAIDLDSSQLAAGISIGGGTIKNIERIGTITGSAFGDTFLLSGQAYATIFAGGGNDTITVSGNFAYIEGGDGADQISLTGGNGYIDGGAGNDAIIVNGANAYAYVRAGAGDDIVQSVGANNLLNGDDGIDTVDYSNSASGVVVNLGTHVGAGGEILDGFENVTGSAFADTLTGHTDDNVLQGAGGNDTLNGDVGNDTLDGGAGNDAMAGGVGDDVYYVDSVSDVVTEASAAGTDTVHTTVTYTLGSNVENGIQDGTSANNLTGNTLANALAGNAAANVLDGGTGNDTLTGGGGVDTFVYRTGGGRDVITDFTAGEAINIYGYTAAQSVVQSASNVVVTLATGNTITVNNSTVAEVMAALHFQTNGGGGTPGTITGTSGADTLNGTSGNDTINGLGGNDTLNGSGGNDALDGGTGNDTMRGGTGNDTYYVDSVSDVVTEASAAGTDTVHTTVTYTLGSNVENGILDGTAAINLTGNTLANTLTGNSAANILDGGTGDDTLTGGSGVDTFVYRTSGGRDMITDFATGETINVYGSTAAQSVVQSGADVVVTFASGNTLTVNDATVASVNTALHFMESGGGTPGTITGTSGADTLNGTSGNDTINGLAGNDTLNGSGGNDTLDGGTGADVMKGGTGNDVYYVDNIGDRVTELSGQGTDEVRSSISYTLGSYVEKATALGSGAINLTGNTLANTLTGNSGANVIKGNGGADTIKGGLGNDTLSGGAGADVFVYTDVASGADKITDFVSGSDKINLHALGITSANVHTAVSGSNLVISVDADHNGSNDFTITLVGVTHIAASDYIF